MNSFFHTGDYMLRHMFILTTILFLLCPSIYALGSESDIFAESDKTDAILSRIKQASQKIETLTGDFIQKKHIEILKDMPDSHGRLFYRSPDRLRWEITDPVIMGFVINGERGRKWHGKSGRSRRFDVREDPVISVISNQVFSWARGDYDKLKDGYNVSVISECPVEIRLVPLSPVEKKYIDSIILAFSKNEDHVNRIEIIEKRGGTTQIIFSNMIINAEIQEDIF